MKAIALLLVLTINSVAQTKPDSPRPKPQTVYIGGTLYEVPDSDRSSRRSVEPSRLEPSPQIERATDWTGFEKPKKPKQALEARQVVLASSANALRWQPAGEEFDSFYNNGIQHKSVTVDGVRVTAAVQVSNIGLTKTVVALVVDNMSGERCEVRPDQVAVMGVRPDYKLLPRETSEQIYRSLSNRAFWGSLLVGFAAALSTDQVTTTYRGALGTHTWTTTMPDYSARYRAEYLSQSLYAAASATGASLQSIELKSQTLKPEQSHAGFLYFKHDRKTTDVMVTVRVSGRTVQIPFDLTAK